MAIIKTLIVLILFFIASISAQDGGLVLVPDSETDHEHVTAEAEVTEALPPPPPFIPTEQWQEVLPGQALPPGLHVEVDMQTGVKRAKSFPIGERPGVLTLSEKRRAKLELLKPSLEKLRVDDVNSSSDAAELHNMADHMADMWKNMVREDMKQIMSILDELALMQDANTGPSTQQQSQARELGLLEDLEDLVHQGDNARDLEHAGAFDVLHHLIARHDVGCGMGESKAQAMVVLGAAAQNNAQVQDDVMKSGFVPLLVDVLHSTCGLKTTALQKRALYALGAVIRHHQPATQAFLDSNGIVHVVDTWARGSNAHVARKAANLILDLIIFATRVEPVKKDTDGERELGRLELLLHRQQLVGLTNVTSLLTDTALCPTLARELAAATSMTDIETFGELQVMMTSLCPLPEQVLEHLREQKSQFADEPEDSYESYLSSLLEAIVQ